MLQLTAAFKCKNRSLDQHPIKKKRNKKNVVVFFPWLEPRALQEKNPRPEAARCLCWVTVTLVGRSPCKLQDFQALASSLGS